MSLEFELGPNRASRSTPRAPKTWKPGYSMGYVCHTSFSLSLERIVARQMGALDQAVTMASKTQPQKKSGGVSEEQQHQIEEDVSKEIERKQEAAKAAEKAQYCKKKAKELTDAAKAAGDPDERQKLLNEALNKEVEAETFGKTAKYLQSGAFQGMVAGTGLGAGIGLWLGTLTGTIVGGTTGTVTGGIGAGVGLGVGAIHGPFVKIGDLMGNTIRKITGDIPGWKATKEQKATLEKMIYGVQEQEVPDEDELETIRAGGATAQNKASKQKDNATSNASNKSSGSSKPSLPSPNSIKSGQNAVQKASKAAPSKLAKNSDNVEEQAASQVKDEDEAVDQSSAIHNKFRPGQAISSASTQKGSQNATPTPNTSQLDRTTPKTRVSSSQAGESKNPSRSSPPKLNSAKRGGQRSSVASTAAGSTAIETEEAPKKKPRKLEVRSAKAANSPSTRRTSQRASG